MYNAFIMKKSTHGYINIYSELNEKELRQLNYKELYKKQNPHWDETLVFLTREFENFTKLYKGKEINVLDFGCGNGNYVIDENSKYISKSVGIDVKPEFVSKNVCLDEIVISTEDTMPFDDESFDVVISLWVLEHLEHPKEVFEEIHRVLKPGGVFMSAAPHSNYFPLKLIHLLKKTKLNHYLNKILFGREEEDIFPAYYLANSLPQIRTLSKIEL